VTGLASASLLAARIPNEEAIALSPTIGWLMLASATCLIAYFMAHGDKWRRWWLSSEDPRGIAMFRIVFGFFVIANVNGMWEHFVFLFTDEGILPAEVARDVFARKQFAGYGGAAPDEPAGFFDSAAMVAWLWGPKFSLLYFWDTPGFFWAHLWAFEICAALFVVGYRTRLMGVLTWFLMNGILMRNMLPWEGTEGVFRCMLAYLILARSGHAYSVDNWLRRRRLRREHRLSTREGPGGGAGHATGLEPIYRLIPSWPRKLIMLQLAALYITTGTVKTGNVWMAGDALYYALNLDHFYRLPPQYLSSIAGTSAFRAMTWAVKVGQITFPLVMFGLIARWVIAQGYSPLRGARRQIARLALIGVWLGSGAIIYVAYPVHFTPPISAEGFVGIWLGIWLGLWGLWRRLGTNPFVVRRVFGRTLARPVTIDRVWVCRWVIGRRVYLLWHLAFHAHIITLMSVGQFQTGMAACTFAFLSGREIATILRDVGHRLARVFPKAVGSRLPDAVVRGEAIIPEADPTLPSTTRDETPLPGWALGAGLAAIAGSMVIEARVNPEWDFRWIWAATAAALVIVTVTAWPPAADAKKERWQPRDRAPLSYGRLGRLLIGGLVAFHLASVAAWLMPDKDSTRAFRRPARDAIGTWIRNTTTTQSWGMFAPNPPRANVFLKVLVTDPAGEVWDLGKDVYAPESKPIPWIWNNRQRKMNRRIIGGESGPNNWYRRWYARYECRQWALDHGGETPDKVELVKMSYRIPPPEKTRAQGHYKAEQRLETHGHQKVLHTERCATAVMGQLSNEIRARHGLPLVPEEAIRPYVRRKLPAWERRKR
jgi:hypothetical protein